MKIAMCVIVLLSLTFLGCSEETPLGTPIANTGAIASDLGPEQDRSAVERPFKGNWQTTLDNFNPEQGTIEIHGIGVATHLGWCTFDTVQPLAPFVPFDATLNADNGDQLDYVAIGNPVENPDEDPFSFSGTLVFEGGTGRFGNATGTATFEGTASLVTMTGEVTYIGTINY